MTEIEDNAAVHYYAGIMRQLIDSERFTDWFSCNFDVQKIVDEEAKTIEYRVIEVPLEVVQERMVEMVKSKCLDESNKVVMANPAEAAAILKGRQK